MKLNNEDAICKCLPFLRWAGGKRWLTAFINEIIKVPIKRYHEPFLGGGAVFFSLKEYGDAFLSDLNPELINTYIEIRDNVDLIIKELASFKNESSFYYEMREKQYVEGYKKAAQLIYLNKTSFNGLYRVNKNGKYNVPYGHKNYRNLFDYNNLRNVSRKLQNARLTIQDFEHCQNNIKKGDLVFLDPPYTTAHENNGFVKYNERIFTWQDQERLLKFILEIKRRKAFFILTNAFHSETKKLFKEVGSSTTIERYSTVGAQVESRRVIKEYIFTNVPQ